ncbi:MAG TPA: hypothetical protein VGL41_08970 [Roseiarcus sp.]
MALGNAQEAGEVFARLRSPADGEKVDQLNEEPGAAAARRAHRARESAQTLDVTVVADPQQRSARHVANAGRLDDYSAGPAARETLVPGDDRVVDEAVLGRTPGHHSGNPGPLRQDATADLYRENSREAEASLKPGTRPRLDE